MHSNPLETSRKNTPLSYADDPLASAYFRPRLRTDSARHNVHNLRTERDRIPLQDPHAGHDDARVVGLDMNRLPTDILPLILSKLRHRLGDLCVCTRVSHLWNSVAQPLLYERIVLRDQGRVVRLFASLAQRLHNARYIKVLEIRVYPFALNSRALDEMEHDLVRSLQSAKNLRHLAWTRTGSLNDRIVADVFPHLHSLRSLELTGDTRTFSPQLLIHSLPTPSTELCCKAILRPLTTKHYALVPWDFGSPSTTDDTTPLAALPSEEQLDDPGSVARAERNMQQRLNLHREWERAVEELMLIMPDRLLSASLPQMAAHLGGLVTRLEILCNHTSFLRDDHLLQTAPYLPLLQHLSLAGCKAVSSEGYVPLVRAARGGLKVLKLESVHLRPEDMQAMAPYLSQLEELTLTYPVHQPPARVRTYFDALSIFMDHLPCLTAFTLYAPGGTDAVVEGEDDSSTEEHAHGIPMSGPALDGSFLRSLLASHGSRLRTLRLYGMGMSFTQLDHLTHVMGQGALQNLVVHLYESDPGGRRLGTYVGRITHLRTLHVLSSARSQCLLEPDEMQYVAERASSTLTQIGFRHRVWIVDRPVQGGVRLLQWDLGAGAYRWPEHLFVVRT